MSSVFNTIQQRLLCLSIAAHTIRHWKWIRWGRITKWIMHSHVKSRNLHYVDKNTKPPTHYNNGSCLSIETHGVKLLVHNFCADVIATGGLELCCYWTTLVTFKNYPSQHLVSALCVAYIVSHKQQWQDRLKVLHFYCCLCLVC